MIRAAFSFIADKGKSLLRAAFVDHDNQVQKQAKIEALAIEIRRIDRLQIMSQSEAWADFDAGLTVQIDNLRLQLEEDDADSKTTKAVLQAIRAVKKWLPDMLAKRTELQDELKRLVDDE